MCEMFRVVLFGMPFFFLAAFLKHSEKPLSLVFRLIEILLLRNMGQ